MNKSPYSVSIVMAAMAMAGGIARAAAFTYDPARPQHATPDVTIDTASLTSDWDARDEELRSPAFFNGAAYPTARYVATSPDKVDASRARVDGQPTLHGVTMPVVMHVMLNGVGTGMMNDRRAGLSGTLKINRPDFGMKTFLPAIGDAMDIGVDAEGSLTALRKMDWLESRKRKRGWQSCAG